VIEPPSKTVVGDLANLKVIFWVGRTIPSTPHLSLSSFLFLFFGGQM
jgi:hypothetical protein